MDSPDDAARQPVTPDSSAPEQTILATFPTAPPPMLGPAPPRGNNPLVLALVLALVLGSVLGLGLLGNWSSQPALGPGSELPIPKYGGTTQPTAGTSATTTTPNRRPVYTLEQHPLLAEGVALPRITCQLPGFGRTLDKLIPYYESGVRCLETAWSPVLAATNLPDKPGKLKVEADFTDSACGTPPGEDEAVAFYCPRDATIYMPTQRLLGDGDGSRSSSHLATLAHEYGHHIQAISGLLLAADDKIEAVGEDSPAGLEIIRRMELQANCFGGMFLRAATGGGGISKSLADRAIYNYNNSLPDKTHGTTANQGRWATIGYRSSSTAACNTWVAPPNHVS